MGFRLTLRPMLKGLRARLSSGPGLPSPGSESESAGASFEGEAGLGASLAGGSLTAL